MNMAFKSAESRITRRHWLAEGCAVWTGLLSQWALGGIAPAKPGAKAKSVILIFNSGAPSHLDLWDPKPAASDNVRGPFRAIETTVPGIRVSELLPDLAARMNQLAVLRTVSHTHAAHNAGMYWSTVGRPYRIDNTLINPSRTDFPCLGTLVGWLAQRDGYSGATPPYVITPRPTSDSPYVTPGQFGSCLGARFDPFVLNADPNASNFQIADLEPAAGITKARWVARLAALKAVDRAPRMGDTESFQEWDAQRDRAVSALQTDQARRAFDLSAEPTAVRERYGRHTWGQSHLLARRLVESGVRFVTTVNGPGITWDTHKDNFTRLKDKLVPPMQQAFVALLDDLTERGLLDSTLVIWMSDFGRTPKINKDAGRDHWPQCYSMVLAGGGIRGGQVIGESDKIGAFPRTRPLSPADVHATVYTALGYDPHRVTYKTLDGRPIPLSEGKPISELL
jgi:hypothetical protein